MVFFVLLQTHYFSFVLVTVSINELRLGQANKPDHKVSLIKSFLLSICKNDRDNYHNGEGLVDGGSIGWHLNPLLLETRYARIEKKCSV